MLPPTDDCSLSSREPLDRPNRGGKILRAVNELPSMLRVKGACKLTGAFVRALFGFFLIWPLLSPPPLLPRSLPLLHFLPLPACFMLRQLRAGAAAPGSGAARFMFRISRLMRTKEINWWFRPNETSVKLTGLINGNK